MTLTDLEAGAKARALWVSGVFHDGADTVAMLSPAADFWARFIDDPEYNDGAPDPMDRWSARVIGAWAADLNAQALFPFGPDASPFLAMARASGRAHSSPVHLLVHDMAGLMISYRGALRIAGHLALPAPPPAPCPTCTRPCTTACPIGALTTAGYDVPACRAYLHSDAGAECLKNGCLVRRACPAGLTHVRLKEQSEFHMRAFW